MSDDAKVTVVRTRGYWCPVFGWAAIDREYRVGDHIRRVWLTRAA